MKIFYFDRSVGRQWQFDAFLSECFSDKEQFFHTYAFSFFIWHLGQAAPTRMFNKLVRTILGCLNIKYYTCHWSSLTLKHHLWSRNRHHRQTIERSQQKCTGDDQSAVKGCFFFINFWFGLLTKGYIAIYTVNRNMSYRFSGIYWIDLGW